MVSAEFHCSPEFLQCYVLPFYFTAESTNKCLLLFTAISMSWVSKCVWLSSLVISIRIVFNVLESLTANETNTLSSSSFHSN